MSRQKNAKNFVHPEKILTFATENTDAQVAEW